MATWKDVERRIAKMIGGVRIPVTGRHNQETPDIDHPRYAPEIKHRAQLPDWLKALVSDTDCVVSLNDGTRVQLHSLGRYLQNQSRPARRCHVERDTPAWIKAAIQQTTAAAKAHGKLPIVIMHQKNQRIKDCICLIPI